MILAQMELEEEGESAAGPVGAGGGSIAGGELASFSWIVFSTVDGSPSSLGYWILGW